MKKTIILFGFGILFIVNMNAQEKQHSQIFDQNIKTLQIKLDDQDLSNPILHLNSNDVLKISFDDLSNEAKNYSYKIYHCNADWTKSNISEFEYLNGYNSADIDDYQQSLNTTVSYTHYVFYFPNENIKPTISGNYIINVYENNNPSNISFTACFSITEQLIDINALVRTNTDIGIRNKYQQIDFDLNTKNYSITDPFSEIKVYIRQNERTDNEVSNIKPSFLSNNKLSYTNNQACIFEAGNEYRSLEISNIHILGDNVNEIKYINPYYHVDLNVDKTRTKNYSYLTDVNGKYVINLQKNNYDNDLEADYLLVHFSFPLETPFFDGQIYLVGGFNFQLLNEQSQMKYINSSQTYNQALLLKQGGYNYQYLFLRKGETKGTSEKIEGNFWETENKYEIYIYHRPQNGRYDKLIGYKTITSNQ